MDIEGETQSLIEESHRFDDEAIPRRRNYTDVVRPPPVRSFRTQANVRDVTDAYLVRDQIIITSILGSSEDDSVDQANEATALICRALIEMGFLRDAVFTLAKHELLADVNSAVMFLIKTDGWTHRYVKAKQSQMCRICGEAEGEHLPNRQRAQGRQREFSFANTEIERVS